jgi:hypothetical protein
MSRTTRTPAVPRRAAAPLADPVPPSRLDELLDREREEAQPHLVFQVAPAFADFALLGIPDPGPLLLGALQALADQLGAGVELVSVAGGRPLDAAQIAEGQAGVFSGLVTHRRRQTIALYPPTDSARALREQACRAVDLGVSDRLSGSSVPFAARLEYRGLEDLIEATLATTDGRLSHTFAPCACGLVQVESVSVRQLSVSLGGGGGLGAPSAPPPAGTSQRAVQTTFSCRIADIPAEFLFDVSLIEHLSTGEIRGVEKMLVDPTVAVTVRQIVGPGLPERVDELAAGDLGQRLLAQLLRPANRVVNRVRGATGELIERLAPDQVLGTFGEVGAALVPDIPIPREAPFEGPLLKVQLATDRVEVSEDRVELIGRATVAPRQVVVGFGATTIGPRVRAQAVTADVRAPTFLWSTDTGTIEGPANGRTVTVRYPAGAPYQLTLRVDNPDEPFPRVASDPDVRGLVDFALAPEP